MSSAASSRPSSAAPQPPPTGAPKAPQPSLLARLQNFWDRLSEGMAIDQLWSQLRHDTRTSYRLYSREVQPYEPPDARKHQRMHAWWHTARQFFWAILMKLSPAKRVILVAALILLMIGTITFQTGPNTPRGEIHLSGIGTLLVLLLLILEIADRVTMKRDLEIAREIQSWLVPSGPPATEQLDIAFTTRPANTVAGDYYDAFSRSLPGVALADQPMLMIVADVAGKSIPAAMLMATLHASLHTLALGSQSLLELAAGLNAYCCEHSNEGRRFTTAFIAQFDPASRVLTSINAGHNAPILLRASGAIERLDAGGVPFGISTGRPYAVDTRKLAQGDLLFIFTDGLIEAEDAGQNEFGEARLLPLLISYRALGSKELIAGIMQQVNGFVGDTPQHDDITVMAVRVK
jgi:sigma-B regulation protein RsbU (phosphoserine phosphatase)